MNDNEYYYLINKSIYYINQYIENLDDTKLHNYLSTISSKLIIIKDQIKNSIHPDLKQLAINDKIIYIGQNYDQLIQTGDKHVILGFVSYVVPEILPIKEVAQLFSDQNDRDDIRFNYQLMKDILDEE